MVAISFFSPYCGKTLGDYICGKDSDRMSYDTPHILLLILILNSCIIKAIYLQPFYDETKTKSVKLTLSTDIRRHSVWGQTASIRCYGICRTSCPRKDIDLHRTRGEACTFAIEIGIQHFFDGNHRPGIGKHSRRCRQSIRISSLFFSK